MYIIIFETCQKAFFVSFFYFRPLLDFRKRKLFFFPKQTYRTQSHFSFSVIKQRYKKQKISTKKKSLSTSLMDSFLHNLF